VVFSYASFCAELRNTFLIKSASIDGIMHLFIAQKELMQCRVDSGVRNDTVAYTHCGRLLKYTRADVHTHILKKQTINWLIHFQMPVAIM
jgi:nucleosome binding factor SPN SPT16 subunit